MKRHIYLSLALTLFATHSFAMSPSFYTAIEKQNWSDAKSAASGDSLMQTYVKWHELNDANYHASVEELRSFITKYPDWPSQETFKSRIEKELFRQNSTQPPWPPISAYGKLLTVRNGDKTILKEAWVEGNFAREDELSIMREFGGMLSPADHQARIERLLADDRATVAERFLLYADKSRLPLYKARIALIRRERNVDGLINKIPASLQNDPWLLCERIVWRKKKGLYASAADGLRAMKPNSPCEHKVWKIRAEFARDAMEASSYKSAQNLLANFGQLEGGPRADLLWLRGWLHYTYLKDYRAAYNDFATLYKNVSYPISKSRGSYWSARAAEKMGDNQRAKENFQLASTYPTTFYGQLAFARLYPGKPLGFPSAPSAGDVNALLNQSSMKLVERLIKDDKVELANPFITKLGLIADTPQKIATLAAATKRLGAEFLGVRAAKFAAKENLVLLREGWPTTDIPKSALEPALPHAIARQESEFNKRAVSHANARGLMQLLPSTAKRVAQGLGLDYSTDKLFEPSFNATLGSDYLAGLVNQFNGSYILAIAGYNAGPGRSIQWMERFGRPGNSIDESIEWIESIPFSETRNYVQRVLENTQTYRAVMQPNTPLGIEADLLR